MTEKQRETFAAKLKELRHASNYSQEEMAKEFSMTRSSWSNYESGRKEPAMETLQKLADFFSVDVKDLIGV